MAVSSHREQEPRQPARLRRLSPASRGASGRESYTVSSSHIAPHEGIVRRLWGTIMQAVRPSIVLLVGQDQAALEQVSRFLAASGHEVRRQDPTDFKHDEVSSYHLALVEASGCSEACLAWCLRLRARPAEPFIPILFV